jgi:hypothetical protein
MTQCVFHPQINAYHDGELDGQAATRFADHLGNCTACSEDLASLENISGLFGDLPETRMYPIELARLHSNLDKTAGSRPAESDFLRTAGLLSSLAASILIISSVWLLEIPSRHGVPLSPGGTPVPASEFAGLPANTPDWERTALTLQVEPFRLNEGGTAVPGENQGIPQVGLADARSMGNNSGSDNSVDAQMADWMVAGLGR